MIKLFVIADYFRDLSRLRFWVGLICIPNRFDDGDDEDEDVLVGVVVEDGDDDDVDAVRGVVAIFSFI